MSKSKHFCCYCHFIAPQWILLTFLMSAAKIRGKSDGGDKRNGEDKLKMATMAKVKVCELYK